MPAERALIFLKKLTHYEPAKSNIEFQKNPTSLGCNIELLVNGKDAWKVSNISSDSTNPKPKKLIISDWSIRYPIASALSEEKRKVWNLLFREGAEIYVWTGKLTKVNSLGALKLALEQVEPIKQADLIQEIAKSGNISKHEYEIIDAQYAQKIRFELRFLLPELHVFNPSALLALNFEKFLKYPSYRVEQLLETLNNNQRINISLEDGSIAAKLLALLNDLSASQQKINTIKLINRTIPIFATFYRGLDNKDKLDINKIELSGSITNTYLDILLSAIPNSIKIKLNVNCTHQDPITTKIKNPIEEIRISCPDENQDKVKAFFEASTHIEHLVIENGIPITFSNYLDKLYELHSIKLLGKAISDKELTCLLTDYSNLKKMTLFNCSEITESFASELAHHNRLTSLSVSMTPGLSGGALAKFLNHSPELSELMLDSLLNHEFLNALAFSNKKFSHLSDLQLTGAIDFNELISFLGYCPNLTTLHLKANISETISSTPTLFLNQLTEINIDGNIQAEQLIELLSHCPNLKKLKLLGIDGEIPLDIPFTLKSLTTLRFSSDTITGKQYGKLLSICPNLDELSIQTPADGELITSTVPFELNKLKAIDFDYRNVSQYTAAQLTSLLSHCPNVKELDIEKLECDSDSSTMTDDQLSKILMLCPNIYSIILTGCKSITGAFLNGKYHFNYLQHVDFSSSEIDEQALVNFINNHPTISKVVLGDKISAERVFKFLLNCENIKTISASLKNEEEKELSTIFPNADINGYRSRERLEANDINITANPGDFPLAEKWLQELGKNSPDFIGSSKALGNVNESFRNTLTDFRSSSNWKQSYKPTRLDIRTKKQQKIPNVREFFLPKDDNEPLSNEYRLQVYPEIILGKEVTYSNRSYPVKPLEKFSEHKNLLDEYKSTYEKRPDVFYGQADLAHIPAEEGWFPLPSLTVHDKILDFSCSNDDVPLQLGFCEEKGLYYVKPLVKSDKPITVSFLLESKKKAFPEKNLINPSLNFQSLSFTRDGRLDKSTEAFGAFAHASQEELISSLVSFCRSFGEGELHVNSDHDMDKLNALLQNKPPVGACRHVTWLFMALAQELGIKARAIENDCHAFVEIKNEHNEWLLLDLGGYSRNLKVEKLNLLDQPQKKMTAQHLNTPGKEALHVVTNPAPEIVTNPAPEIVTNPTPEIVANPTPEIPKKEKPKPIILSPDNPFRTWDTLKSNAKTYEQYCQDVMSAATQLPEQQRNVLVVLDENQIEAFHAHMTECIHTSKHQSYYLPTLGDVNELQAKVTPEGRLELLESELVTLAREAKTGDVILSNQSDYKPSYVGYNTMLDDDRTLKATAISPEATVMVVIDKNKLAEMGEDFYSRFRMVCECPSLPQDNDLQAKCALKQDQPIHGFAKTEFFDSDWHNVLLGHINISGHQFNIKEGALVTALKEGKPGLLLENAPWHLPEFRIFLTELLCKKSFSHNGTQIKVPDHFEIVSTTKSYVLKSDTIRMGSLKANPVILNSQTFKLFLQQIECKNEGIYTHPGLLEANRGRSLDVCVTETLPDHVWAHLIHLAEEHHCQLNLVLAPKVSLPEGMELKPEQIPAFSGQNSNLQIVTTNDLELAEEETLAANPKAQVVSINSKIEFSDLIEKPVKLPEHCELLLTSTPPDERTINDLPIKSNTAYIRYGQQLFYVDKVSRICRELPTPREMLASFDDTLEPTQENRTLSADELKQVASIIKQPHPFNVSFQSVSGSVWKQLVKGETVILKGSVSPVLVRELESLLMDPPYLWINGKKETPKGKLVILSDVKPPLSLVNSKEKKYEESDYWAKFDEEYKDLKGYAKFKDSLNKLKNKKLSYGQLRTMLDKLSKGHPSNPFKPFFRLNSKDPILVSAKDAWEKIPKEKSADFMKRRYNKISEELKHSPYLFVVGPSGVGKSTFIIDELRQDNKDVHVGIDNLEQWLLTNNGKDQVLFIDEANLEREGTWDILEGLFNKTPGILYNGTFYPVSDQHKVIFAGNFNHFAGRENHRYFDRHGQVINFKEMPDDVLTKLIIMPALKATQAETQEGENTAIIKTLLATYKHINETVPDHVMTPRNLKNICLRLHEYLTNHNGLLAGDKNFALQMAIVDEASGFLKKTDKREFKKWLGIDNGKRKSLQDSIQKKDNIDLKGFIVVPGRKNAIGLLHKQFTLRSMALSNPELHSFNVASLLIEGMPGIGKSRMVIEYLKSQGYTQGTAEVSTKDAAQVGDETIDTSRTYYHLTPTDPDLMQATLLKAFYEGSVVIIDELNSLPFERILNQLLSGYDLDGNKLDNQKIKKGFLVIGTQNPSVSFSGRQALSTAFENRFRKLYLKNYLDEELLQITERYCPNKAKAEHIVNEYIAARNYAIQNKKRPAPTPRDLFAYLKMHKTELMNDNKNELETQVITEPPKVPLAPFAAFFKSREKGGDNEIKPVLSMKEESEDPNFLRKKLQSISNKIINHPFNCYGGGKEIDGKIYPNEAQFILKELQTVLSKVKISNDDCRKVLGSIKNELKNKRVTTWGFFGIGKRDKSTVDLYETLFSNAEEGIPAKLVPRQH